MSLYTLWAFACAAREEAYFCGSMVGILRKRSAPSRYMWPVAKGLVFDGTNRTLPNVFQNSPLEVLRSNGASHEQTVLGPDSGSALVPS
jgi:hypothetical protein